MFPIGDVLIQKFGGSSVASAERIKMMAKRVAAQASKGKRVVLVVSAMGNTTDDLLELMRKVSIAPQRREVDSILATGEIVAASLAASALIDLGINARSFNAFNLHLLSKLEGDDYNITDIGKKQLLAEFLQPGSVAVVAGFQGITSDGDLTTLGRGGSDLTAVIMARELGQKVCEKYTDEDGVYTADPRVVKEAFKVWHLSYHEMLELAHFGNGILHPRAITTACENNIRIHVRSSFTTAEGTVVGPDGDDQIPVKSIASDDSFVISRIHGVTNTDSRFFSEISNAGFVPVMFQFKPYNDAFGSIRLAFKKRDVFDAMAFIWGQAYRLKARDVETFADLATVTLVGVGINKTEAAKYKSILSNHGITPIISEHKGIRLSFSVRKDKIHLTLDILHKNIAKK